ncbi:MAG: multidrug effflux MFS transporter [Gammaproteobacteria bacterium]|nr:multidrug effflux MFS transporter [Gammaproteobacteria bacterium]
MMLSIKRLNITHLMLPLSILFAVMLEIGSADILLPALKGIQEMYAVDSTQVERLVSYNLLGLALSSLIYGPLSDRFGRRPIYLFGVGLFAVTAGCLCFLQSFNQLLILRLIQGLGGGVCVTVGFAMLKDQYDNKGYTKTLAWIGAIVTASPAVYPLIGAYLLHFGVFYIFYFTAISAVVVFGLLWLYLPETNHSPEFKFKSYLKDYSMVITDHRFILFATIFGLAYAVIWVYVAVFALLALKTYGFSPENLGWLLLISVVCAGLGSYAQAKLINYCSISQCLLIGIVLAVISGLGLMLVFLPIGEAWILIGFSSLYWFSNTLIFANANDLALDLFPEHNGIAASYLAASELFWSAGTVWLGARLYNGTATPIAVITLGCAVLMSIMFVFLWKNKGVFLSVVD